MAEDPARVALIGYGLAGAVFHAPLIAATEGLQLSAVVTRDPARREALGKRHPGAVALDSADDVWRAAGDYELVVVATPNKTHAKLAEAAVRAGLPVVIDKPLAVAVKQAADLIELAREQSVPLTVFQNRRWDGDFLTVKRLIDSGALGDVWRFESRFERWRGAPGDGWRELGDVDQAGGVLFDLGSHLIDQALQLFGPVAAISGERDARRPGAEADDDAFVAIEHRSGVTSHLWMSAVAARSGPRFRLLGSKAAYVKFGLDPQERQLAEGASPGSDGWGLEEPSSYGSLGDDGHAEPVATAAGDYGEFYRGVVAMLAGGPPPVDPADALDVLEVIEQVRNDNPL